LQWQAQQAIVMAVHGLLLEQLRNLLAEKLSPQFSPNFARNLLIFLKVSVIQRRFTGVYLGIFLKI
jgi:hypothetical protein